jgi:hypothetical protein
MRLRTAIRCSCLFASLTASCPGAPLEEQHDWVMGFGSTSPGGSAHRDQVLGLSADGFGLVVGCGVFDGQSLMSPYDQATVGVTSTYDNASFVFLDDTLRVDGEGATYGAPWLYAIKPINNGSTCRAEDVASVWPWDGLDYDLGRPFVCGHFSGSMMLDSSTTATSSGVRDGFVAKYDPLTESILWNRQFAGPNHVRAFGIDISDVDYCTDHYSISRIRLDESNQPMTPCATQYRHAIVGVVGGFTDTAMHANDIDFDYVDQPGVHVASSNGGEDAFITILSNKDGHIFAVLTIGGTGDDRALDVCVTEDPDDDEHAIVYVGGYFSNSVDFNPNGASVVRTAVGGTDGFVACYSLEIDPSGTGVLLLECIHSTGTDGNDQVTSIDGGPNAPVLAAGHLHDGVKRDIWCSVLDHVDGTPSWMHAFQAAGDQAATGVCRDTYGDILLSGFFAATVDFDPGPAADSRTSAGSFDTFLLKLDAGDQSYLGADAIGGSAADVATAMTFDADHARALQGGYFGAASSGEYTVDFDTRANSDDPLTSLGLDDGYVRAVTSSGLWAGEAMICFVVDRSGSMEDVCTVTGRTQYEQVMLDVAAMVGDGSSAGLIPRDDTVALSLVLFNELAQVGIEWTRIENESDAQGFANAVNALAQLDETGGTRHAQGIERAVEMYALPTWGGSDLTAAVRSINLITDDRENSLPEYSAAMDEAFDSSNGPVDFINAVGICEDPADVADWKSYFATNMVGVNPHITDWENMQPAALICTSACPPQQGTPSEFYAMQFQKLLCEVRAMPCSVADTDFDCDVDMSDLGAVLASMDKCVGDPFYDPLADVNNSGCVDISDLGAVLAGFQNSDCPQP